MQGITSAVGSIVSAAAQSATATTGSIHTGFAPSTSTAADTASGSGPFSSLVSDAVSQVDSLETQARVAADGLMTGTGVDVHEAMIAAQKAEMAFEMTLAVRNKAVQAYQQVMGMQF
jgi:flagellar hook-basal body complex protein FliE